MAHSNWYGFLAKAGRLYNGLRMSTLSSETLYFGDCLDWMSRWDDQCVDLIYLDPPFNSKSNYNVLYSTSGGHNAQYRAFKDTWAWDEAAADRFCAYEGAPGRKAHDVIMGFRRILGPSGMLAYLTYMAERLEQMWRLLKPTGSIYLHCDPTASHYLKLVLDAIFGPRNFRNEVVWCYSRPSAPNQRQLSRVHDTVFWYSGGGGGPSMQMRFGSRMPIRAGLGRDIGRPPQRWPQEQCSLTSMGNFRRAGSTSRH